MPHTSDIYIISLRIHYIDVKKRFFTFFYVFLFRARFYVFNVFYFSNVFLFLKTFIENTI